MQKRLVSPPELRRLLATGAPAECLRLPARSKWPVRRTRGASFRQVDFHAPMVHGGLLGRLRFEDCRFDRCDWSGVHAQKVDFVRCAFVRTIFGRDTLAALIDCSFRDCSFEQSTFQGGQWTRCQAHACRFEDTRFVDIRFRGTRLEGCCFTGLVRGTTLVECALHSVDLSAAQLRDFAMLDCEESSLALPRRPDSFFVAPGAFLEARAEVERALPGKFFASYCEFAEILARCRGRQHVDPETFREFAPADRDKVLAILYLRCV